MGKLMYSRPAADTLCLIDAQNIYYTPKKIFRSRMDFQKLKAKICKGRHVYPMIYLVSDAAICQENFVHMLQGLGFITRMKLMYFIDGKVQNTNWDDEMIEDGRKWMKDYQGLILVSGDGGFSTLINEYKRAGKWTEAMCFENDLSPALTDCADQFNILDESVLM